jgi:Ni,Fe-hydrogenase III small subunit
LKKLHPYYNLEGMGIKFVTSPRHADMLLVTGPVSVNLEEALRRTCDSVPEPKLVLAVGIAERAAASSERDTPLEAVLPA